VGGKSSYTPNQGIEKIEKIDSFSSFYTLENHGNRVYEKFISFEF
jgi:hypothetical protein